MSSSMSSIGNQNIGVSPHVARIMNMVNTAERNSLGNLVCVCGDHALHSDHRNTWFAESTARIVPCADLENTQSVTYLTRTHALVRFNGQRLPAELPFMSSFSINRLLRTLACLAYSVCWNSCASSPV